jgi:hypothetical protein
MNQDLGTPRDRRASTAELAWMLWTAIGIGGIWVAVLLLSLLAPDLVSGSQQDHLPIAAFTTWFLGRGRHPGVAVGDGSAAGPRGVAADLDRAVAGDAGHLGGGHDPGQHPAGDGDRDRPTQIPFAAIFAPPAAAMLTALAGAVATVFRGGPGGE